MPHAKVGLSTASVYPENCATAFELAARLGYDGVEVMVWTDPVTREAGALAALAAQHGIPVLSVHAPTLLVTQRVWGTDPWEKVDRSVELALELGADTVVLHPPFRWQRDYARDFVDGVALREHDTGIRLAVENMYPWRGPRSRELEAYLPHWDPVPQPYDHVTIDLSHTATAGSDALAMVRGLGPRLSPPAPRRRRRVAARRAPGPRAGHASRAARCSRPLRHRGMPVTSSSRWPPVARGRPSASSTSRSRWPSRGCTSRRPSARADRHRARQASSGGRLVPHGQAVEAQDVGLVAVRAAVPTWCR